MKKIRVQWLIIGLISLFILVACADNNDSEVGEPNDVEQTSQEEVFQIGASQFVEHPSLDAAYEGFQAAIEDAGLTVEFNHQSAQGDQNNTKPIADNFVADDVDLIFANSTPSEIGRAHV